MPASNNKQSNAKLPPPSNRIGSQVDDGSAPPPVKIAIENVDFIQKDQKQKELQDTVNRHQARNREQRHKRNASLGQTPSISEEIDVDFNDDDFLRALHQQDSFQFAPLAATEVQKPPPSAPPHHRSNSEPEKLQQKVDDKQDTGGGMTYMVPLRGGSTEGEPEPQQAASHPQSQQKGYVPWPAGSGYNYYAEKAKSHRRTLSDASSKSGDKLPTSITVDTGHITHQEGQIHPLKKDANTTLEYSREEEEEDEGDEYAALLQQQHFSMPGGYGSTMAAVPPAMPKGTPFAGGRTSGTPPTGRRIQDGLPLPGYPPRKPPSSPSYPQGRARTHSENAMMEYQAQQQYHYQQQQAYYYQQQYQQQQQPPPPPPPSHRSPVYAESPPHIHRRSHSDNYKVMAQQQHQQYQYQQHQHQQHPLLRDNSNASKQKPPIYSNAHSPRLGGTSPKLRPPNSAGNPSNRKMFESFPAASPGHRRARSGSGRLLNVGYRHTMPPNMMGGGAALSPNMNLSQIFPGQSPFSGLSSSTSLGGGSAGGGRVGHHRRSSSMASSGGLSVASEASFMSVVSDIRKSSFYSGYDEATGNVQLHYPRENVHLTTNRKLHKGWVYSLPVDTEAFEEYHRLAEDAMLQDDDDLEHGLHQCGCQCPACYHGCTGHKANNRSKKPKDPFQQLPPVTFALAIDENIYKSVLDEISQASTMPCGLFYCGHHEDVSHPSIMIAAFIVFSLLFTMGGYAYYVQA